MRAIFVIIMAALLAGCAQQPVLDTGSADVEFVVTGAPEPVELELAGAWLREQGNGSWVRLAPAGSVLALDARDGVLAMKVAAGAYERLRVVLRNVTVAGEAATLGENGFELPLNVTLAPGTTSRISIGFAWADALFRSAQGLAFQPALQHVEVSVDGDPVLVLLAEQIQTAPTKQPVARMEIFDANAARVFETDFVAESPERRIIGVGPNLTFQAAGSEAVEAGATIAGFAWEFGDGAGAEGPTVSHLYPLSGGNFTVRLTVTDSLGVADAQTVKMALQPGTFAAKQPFAGTVTGAYSSTCATSTNGNGMKTHMLPVEAAMTPDGVPADLIAVRINLYVLGNPHAGANIDLRVLDADGGQQGTGATSGTSEEVSRSFAPGKAPGGDWTIQVKPCLAYDLDYEVVATLTWLAKEPEPGYLAWLADYNDGHDHQH